METGYWFTCARPQDLKKDLDGARLKGREEQRIALVGRSNVGKSSLVNALLGSITAKVSRTPGKTRTLNFFFWNADTPRILVDLPGYGFAQVAKGERDAWRSLVSAYITTDPKLRGVLLLWDARHGPTASDKEALEYFLSEEIPLQIVFTKLDSLKTQSERSKRRREGDAFVKKHLGEEAKPYWVSSKTGDGLRELQYHLIHDEDA